MIGILLSETFEVVYVLSKATYDGSVALYRWYYGIEEEKTEMKELEEKVNEMGKQLEELKKLIH